MYCAALSRNKTALSPTPQYANSLFQISCVALNLSTISIDCQTTGGNSPLLRDTGIRISAAEIKGNVES